MTEISQDHEAVPFEPVPKGGLTAQAVSGNSAAPTEVEPQQPQGAKASTPQGWRLVPVEPTEEMLSAAKGGAIFDARMDAVFKRGLLANWASMLAAAPAHPHVRTDPSQPWTPEHCRSYPTEAAALLNARAALSPAPTEGEA